MFFLPKYKTFKEAIIDQSNPEEMEYMKSKVTYSEVSRCGEENTYSLYINI